jgi:hypothetical protein
MYIIPRTHGQPLTNRLEVCARRKKRLFTVAPRVIENMSLWPRQLAPIRTDKLETGDSK